MKIKAQDILNEYIDLSTNPTVVQYSIQTILKKGVSPASAAKSTVKKLSGGTNLFLSQDKKIFIDSEKLEGAIWDYLIDDVLKSIEYFKHQKQPELAVHDGLWATINKFYGFMSEKRDRMFITLKDKLESKFGKKFE